jgi:peptide/nickel transport system substrate-binding protein
MDSRFTLKDFVFLALFVVVIGAVGVMGWMFHYQELRLNDVKSQMGRLADNGQQQLTVLTEIRNSLRGGVRVAGGVEGGPGAQSQPGAGRIRRKNADGSQYVYYPDVPKSPRAPLKQPGYAAGDWQVQNMGVEPKVITPYIEKDLYGQLAQAPVMETLLTMNPDTFEYEPLLADTYEISADGLVYRFRLRKEVCFSDGVPMTSKDVLFTYHTIMNEEVDAAPLRSYLSSVKSCTAIDDRTVEFRMTEPYFGALNTLGLMLILPEHTYKFEKGEDYNKRGDFLVGSGPYKLDTNGWQQGQRLVMVRNDKYWGDRPTFDKLVFTFIQNPQAGVQALIGGQIDALATEICGAPVPEQFLQFTADKSFMEKFTAIKYGRPTAGYSFMGYNLRKAMFKDKETRQALTMLLDRKAIISTILKDQAMESMSPFSPMTPQHDPKLKAWPYDPEAAKQKLAAAGWKPGSDGVLVRDGVRFEFELSMGSNNPIADRIAAYAKEQFAHAGILMKITPWEFAVLMGRVDDRNFDALMMGWSAIVEDDPRQVFHSASIPNKGSNALGFSNEESDKLIDEARRTLDTDKRMALWHQWEALISEEQPETFLYARLDRAFVAKRFKNVEPYNLGIVPLDWFVPSGEQKYR